LADDEHYVVIDVVIGGDIVQKRFNAVGGAKSSKIALELIVESPQWF
jgi:hypothetical protein